jgi:hypothetical protein
MKLDYLIQKVDIIDKRTETYRERLEKVENTVRVLKWGGGAVATIGIALLISWLRVLLGF